MTQPLLKNNAFASLASSLSDSATGLSVATGQGARFPAISGGDYFFATLIGLDGNGAETSWEIVKVTTRATDGMTVVRGQEGTTPAAWPSGTRIEMRITAGMLNSIIGSSNSSTGYVNAAATLTSGIHYFVDSSAASFTLDMPASPGVGNIVKVTDAFSSWANYPVTLNRNGSNFVDPYGASQAEDFILNIAGLTSTFIYTASGWKAI